MTLSCQEDEKEETKRKVLSCGRRAGGGVVGQNSPLGLLGGGFVSLETEK